MNVKSQKTALSGSMKVPGSKSHTMRACMFASFAEGTSVIRNPLETDDCRAAARAAEFFGSHVTFGENRWIIEGAGAKAHLPENVVNVGCSGAALYMLAPVAATFSGWTVFTGDETLRQKPVQHMIDDLLQLDCGAYKTAESRTGAPVLIHGPFRSGSVVTKGHYSLALNGLLLAGARSAGKMSITLTDPKETPYLEMTKNWFASLKMKVSVSPDYRSLEITGPQRFPAFERTIPADWESIAFPLVAGVISDSEFEILDVDTSGGQGDAAIAGILKSMGADIELIEEDARAHTGRLVVRGGTKSRLANKGRLHGVTVNCSSYPDVVTALSVAASFADGVTRMEDVSASRRKAVDRVEIMAKELAELGVSVEEDENALVIHGSEHGVHGGVVESYSDHRVAMALAVFGLGLKSGTVEVRDAECADVSFPGFYELLNSVGAGFVLSDG